MQSAPKDLLKKYVQSQQFTSTADIMQAMKEMFRDVIEQVMEVEMDDELGRERCQRLEEPEGQAKNYRNGYSKKTVKTQPGEAEIKVPRDRQGNCEPKIIGKYDRNAEGMEEKILALYACGMSQRDISEQIKELYSKSYKLKKRIPNLKEDMFILPGTQEAIVPQEQWERAQELRKNKRRITKGDRQGLFSGLLFCADCGSKLHFATCKRFESSQDRYVCAKYRGGLFRPHYP